jgi:hypothetical protein
VTRQVLAEAGDKVGKMAIENTSARRISPHGHDQVRSWERTNVTQMAGLAQQIVEGHL